MKDSPYTDNNPFFSPSIAKFCKDRTCVFASWGQQAHLATIHKGVALYYTMYTDCGNGVIEFSQIIHNAADNGDDLSYLNVPWGGPRKSTLRSYVQANSNNELEHRWPIHDWGNFVENLSSLGGYTVFADKLKLPDAQCQYDLPVVNGESIQLVVANKDSHTAFMSWHTNQWGVYAVRTEVSLSQTCVSIHNSNMKLFQNTKRLILCNISFMYHTVANNRSFWCWMSHMLFVTHQCRQNCWYCIESTPLELGRSLVVSFPNWKNSSRNQWYTH